MGDRLVLPGSVRDDLEGARGAYAELEEADNDFFDLDDRDDVLRRFWSFAKNVIRDSLAADVEPGKLATALGKEFPLVAAGLHSAVNDAQSVAPLTAPDPASSRGRMGNRLNTTPNEGLGARMTQAAPAGWYSGPENPTQQRYWDGAAWTQSVNTGPLNPHRTIPRTPAAPPNPSLMRRSCKHGRPR